VTPQAKFFRIQYRPLPFQYRLLFSVCFVHLGFTVLSVKVVNVVEAQVPHEDVKRKLITIKFDSLMLITP
jgi:hypothetical protein